MDLSRETMEKALNHAGCFIAAATSRLCPADKMMYRVRDITSTVDNINLIARKFLYLCIDNWVNTRFELRKNEKGVRACGLIHYCDYQEFYV